MIIKVIGKVLEVVPGKIKKGENVGKDYYMLHAYVDGDLIKSFIPEDKVAKSMEYIGKELNAEITYDLDLAKQKLYFKDIK